MSVFKTITLGGTTMLRPNDMQPDREYVFAGEIVTCTGKTIADLIGWKYSDITLEWDTLPQAQLNDLLALNGTQTTLTFEDADGTTASEQVIPLTHSLKAKRRVSNGVPEWDDIKTTLRFLNVHNY